MCQGTTATGKTNTSSTLPNVLVCACSRFKTRSLFCRRRHRFLYCDSCLCVCVSAVKDTTNHRHVPESESETANLAISLYPYGVFPASCLLTVNTNEAVMTTGFLVLSAAKQFFAVIKSMNFILFCPLHFPFTDFSRFD